MRTYDQHYAIEAYKQVDAVKKTFQEEGWKRYGVMAHKLPILIHTAGLVQALEFVNSRKKKEYNQLLTDLWCSISNIDREGTQEREAADKDAFLARVRNAELEEYMYLTQQVKAALTWYKRYAQSILDVDASAQTEE